jgi:hypothetical protein
MPSFLANPWNNAVAYLAMYKGLQSVGSGTAFFWRFSGRTFLVTNWHNLSGRNPLTGAVISAAGVAPEWITLHLYKRVTEPDEHGYFGLNYEPVKIGLLQDGCDPKWLQHPTHKQHVDVAAMDVTDDVVGYQVAHANEIEGDAVLDPFASQDVFVVGFPFGRIADAPAPMWKRGSIALDPSFDAQGLPKMLVDTATRPGMSGSVVLGRHIIVGRDYPKKDGSRSPQVIYSQKDLVVGVYSGRLDNELEKAQIGIVWKRRAIEETVASGVRIKAVQHGAAPDDRPQVGDRG